MIYNKNKLITNKFELVLLILLSFIISTRLIWLQIDNRNQTITDEFYSSSLYFMSHLSDRCSMGVDSIFPYPSDEYVGPLDSDSELSPGLVLGLLGACQLTRLNMTTIYSIAPQLIGLSALIVAISTRILISNWVGGMLAASVVLSRGSILQGTHLAGTYLLLHPVISFAFLLLVLYARTRNSMLLPALFFVLLVAGFIQPSFTVLAWVLAVLVLVRAILLNKRNQVKAPQLRIHLVSTISMLITLPILTVILYRFLPQATRPLVVFIKQQILLNSNFTQLKTLVGSAVAELEMQDFHWQFSIAVLLLAATWRRFLPRGSGFACLAIVVIAFAALYFDGSIIAAAAEESHGINIRRIYKMRQAVFSLEPLIIGISSGYAWFGVRYLISTIVPNYSYPVQLHDKIDDN